MYCSSWSCWIDKMRLISQMDQLKSMLNVVGGHLIW